MIVLSHFQTEVLFHAKKSEETKAVVSTDLNLSQNEVLLDPEGPIFPNGLKLSWEAVEEIHKHKSACFMIEESGALKRIHYFSPTFQRAYSLLPTERTPTMLLAGFPMHRIKGIDPQEDTHRKIQSISPVLGPVLDTATGLGYTAIQAAQTASQVVTIELDPMVLEVCRCNPWSQELFTNPRIQQQIGNAVDVIQTLENQSFQRIYHDPPAFQLAGELYSETFYRQLFRILHRGGRLFHYIGDLESTSGSRVVKGVVRRLQNAGFQRIQRVPEAFGVTASI
jgi:predicted methyltransferase